MNSNSTDLAGVFVSALLDNSREYCSNLRMTNEDFRNRNEKILADIKANGLHSQVRLKLRATLSQTEKDS